METNIVYRIPVWIRPTHEFPSNIENTYLLSKQKKKKQKKNIFIQPSSPSQTFALFIFGVYI